VSKHTPGPWWLYANESPIVIRGGQGDDEIHVCTVNAPWSNAQALADARLIAAAPDLLEALKDGLAGLEQFVHDPDTAPRVLSMRAAIAKAEPKG
jgi:hypothetical protein